jgi:hypothetical protein
MCNVHAYAKMDGIFSKAALYIGKTLFGSFVGGLCGNCNDVEDDYDVLGLNKSAVDAPIQIADKFTFQSETSFFPWKD